MAPLSDMNAVAYSFSTLYFLNETKRKLKKPRKAFYVLYRFYEKIRQVLNEKDYIMTK